MSIKMQLLTLETPRLNGQASMIVESGLVQDLPTLFSTFTIQCSQLLMVQRHFQITGLLEQPSTSFKLLEKLQLRALLIKTAVLVHE